MLSPRHQVFADFSTLSQLKCLCLVIFVTNYYNYQLPSNGGAKYHLLELPDAVVH